MRNAERRRAKLELRDQIAAHARPLVFTVIGMAEVGEHGVVEQRVQVERNTLIGEVVATARSVISEGKGPTKTRVGVPLLIHGNVLGAISLESPIANACAPHDLALIQRVAGALAMVVENTRLFRQLDRRAREIEEAYRRQEAMLQTISELSSTIVPIARGVLVVPMVGTIDTRRAAEFVETLLTSISERQARVVIIDITGVTVVDTSVAHHILQAAQAAQLLGAQVIVVGITPAVAQTVVQLGVQLPGISTFADLETGFAYALAKVGGRLLYDKEPRKQGSR
jgi:anti-anti-sigma factor